jgi:hypothetical protein
MVGSYYDSTMRNISVLRATLKLLKNMPKRLGGGVSVLSVGSAINSRTYALYVLGDADEHFLEKIDDLQFVRLGSQHITSVREKWLCSDTIDTVYCVTAERFSQIIVALATDLRRRTRRGPSVAIVTRSFLRIKF